METITNNATNKVLMDLPVDLMNRIYTEQGFLHAVNDGKIITISKEDLDDKGRG